MGRLLFLKEAFQNRGKGKGLLGGETESILSEDGGGKRLFGQRPSLEEKGNPV